MLSIRNIINDKPVITKNIFGDSLQAILAVFSSMLDVYVVRM